MKIVVTRGSRVHRVEPRSLQVVRTLLSELGLGDHLIRFVRDRPGHDSRYAMDATRAGRELGWRPKVAFEDRLASTVRWYRENEAWWAGAGQLAGCPD